MASRFTKALTRLRGSVPRAAVGSAVAASVVATGTMSRFASMVDDDLESIVLDDFDFEHPEDTLEPEPEPHSVSRRFRVGGFVIGLAALLVSVPVVFCYPWRRRPDVTDGGGEDPPEEPERPEPETPDAPPEEDADDVMRCDTHALFYEKVEGCTCIKCHDDSLCCPSTEILFSAVPFELTRGRELVPAYIGREYLNGIPRHHWQLSSPHSLVCSCGQTNHVFEFEPFHEPIWFKPASNPLYALFPTNLQFEGETTRLVLSTFGYLVGRYGNKDGSRGKETHCAGETASASH